MTGAPASGPARLPAAPVPVRHRRVDVDGVDTFFREAGPEGAPALLLPHGYPCSSFEFRHLMALLGDRWRCLAPDFPGQGLSATPEGFAYDFDGYARFLGRFASAAGAEGFALWLHDFGSQVGLRLAIAEPGRVRALIVQNGDVYEDALGPRYDALRPFWANPTAEGFEAIREAVSREGFEEEFRQGLSPEVASRLPPELWDWHWWLTSERRRDLMAGIVAGLRENLLWFPRYQAWLREHRPPALILWGPQDGYMPEAAGRAWLRDLPDAELRILPDAGHWLLETHLAEAADLTRAFLDRALPSPSAGG